MPEWREHLRPRLAVAAPGSHARGGDRRRAVAASRPALRGAPRGRRDRGRGASSGAGGAARARRPGAATCARCVRRMSPPPITPGAPAGHVLARSLAGPPLRRAHVVEAARLRGRRRPHARAGHRRQHGDLQRGLRRAAEAAAVPRAGPAGRLSAPRARAQPAVARTWPRHRTSPIATSSRVFEDIGAWDTDEVSITGRGEPERVEALAVTDGLLPLLRVQPLLGRLFTKEDDAPGARGARS